ncbi:nucleoside hydrolase [Cyclobacterium jeungdonense]|uniref:Nucleoside hydrolase n=1 Tax=Cyclobacterium jeungdonense TaxID=708087 RepID=A0ABT8CAI1_9BACT|nr:nucleoside hydrolase [Cyclobacterium jeungdonense]MDN3689809.1 nucleoside hydrolase [Cyclobacterium jeungdonense]
MKKNLTRLAFHPTIRKSSAVLGLVLFFLVFDGFSQNYPGLTDQFRLSQLEPPQGKVQVVIDTDTYNEIDDQFAVVYGLLSPDQMEVKAIYAAPYLNNRSVSPKDGMEKSFEEIERLLDKLAMKRENYVYRGSDAFLESLDKPIESPAAKDLISKAMNSEGPLYVLTLGAPTNVASAILLEPEIIHKIVVVWLGGKGLNWKTATEFNLMQDPIASQILFDSGVPLIQIPTQPVTSHLATTVAEIETYLKGKGEIGDYLVEIFNDYNKGDPFGWSKVIWDISAIAYVINPGWFNTEIRSSPLLTDQLTYSFDNTRHLYRVATYLNRDRIFGDMFKKIQQYTME